MHNRCMCSNDLHHPSLTNPNRRAVAIRLRKEKKKKNQLLKLSSYRGLIRKAPLLHTPSVTSTALFFSIYSPVLVISLAPLPRSRRNAGVVFFCRLCCKWTPILSVTCTTKHTHIHAQMPSRSFHRSTSLFLLPPCKFHRALSHFPHLVQYLAIDTFAKQTLQPHDKVNLCMGGSRGVTSPLICIYLFIYVVPSHNDTNR